MDDSCVCLWNATLTLQIGFLIMDGFVCFFKNQSYSYKQWDCWYRIYWRTPLCLCISLRGEFKSEVFKDSWFKPCVQSLKLNKNNKKKQHFARKRSCVNTRAPFSNRINRQNEWQPLWCTKTTTFNLALLLNWLRWELAETLTQLDIKEAGLGWLH